MIYKYVWRMQGHAYGLIMHVVQHTIRGTPADYGNNTAKAKS